MELRDYLTLSLPNQIFTIPCQDELGNVNGKPMQEVLDRVYSFLCRNCQDSRPIWDKNAVRRWSDDPATDRQKELISRYYPDFDCDDLTKGQASRILQRTFSRKETAS